MSAAPHRRVQRRHGDQNAEDDGEDGDANVKAAVVDGAGVEPVEQDTDDSRAPHERADLYVT